MPSNNFRILPSFITPAVPKKKKQDGGSLPTDEPLTLLQQMEGNAGQASAVGQITQAALPVIQGVNEIVANDPKHGINKNKLAVNKAAEMGATGAQLGTAILPGIGTAIGAGAGAIGGAIIGAKQADSFNEEYSKNFREDYDQLQAKEQPTLFMQDGGALPNDGSLPGQYNEFNGNKHEQDGIPLGDNVEVEGGEVRWEDYIFSDTLTPGKNFKV